MSSSKTLESCTLPVDGLDCASCAATVDRALRSVPGVESVSADIINERVSVTFGPPSAVEDLRAAIAGVGYRVRDPAGSSQAVYYRIEGLCCATEARQIEGRLAHRPDVRRLDFDLVGKRVRIEGSVPASVVQREVRKLGMRASPVGTRGGPEQEQGRSERLLFAGASGVSWLAAVVAALVGWEPGVAVFSTGAMIAGGRYIVPRGLQAARTGALDMNFLMSVAAVGAILIGEYLEGASTMFLFAFAQFLEARTMDRARNAIRSLMELSPTVAMVVREGREVRVAADAVEIGEVVIVRPGDRIPVDGEVRAGRSSVNQSPITGESLPVDKEPGAQVFAGTINGEGVLEVEASRAAEDTTLARIIHSVEEAQSSRAPSQAFVDRFARIYTPAAVLVAAVIGIVPPLFTGDWNEWIYRALVLLVVACPCALVISTPVTIVSALVGAARRGILIKGGLHLENAGSSRVVAIDKTGTLTKGEPTVVAVVPLNGSLPREIVGLAAAAESRSEHPLARAVTGHAAALGLTVPAVSDTMALPGLGVRAKLDGRYVFVGSERLFAERGAPPIELFVAPSGETRGSTRILVGTAATENGPITPQGAIYIADEIRPGAIEALRGLRSAGIERIIMLTGDNQQTAEAIAEKLGELDGFRADLLPAEKVHAVRELRQNYGKVTFVGDGINDAPALAVADVGVAMGSAGTDAALETADIALMADDLTRLPVMFRISRKAERIIRANIVFSLLSKAAFVALAMGGWATLWMAVLADMGTSLIVIANGMRAMRVPSSEA